MAALTMTTFLPAQCRAARALIEMDQAALAEKAGISRNVVVDFENGRRTPMYNNLAAIRHTLETAGVVLIGEDGDGVGVRLRKRNNLGRIVLDDGKRPEELNAENDD